MATGTISREAVETRTAKIRRYVVLDAMDSLILGGPNNAIHDLLGPYEAGSMDSLASQTWEELWPLDAELGDVPGSPDSLEANLANIRGALLAADLFDRLVEIGPDAATWYRDYAANKLAHIQAVMTENAE